MIFNPTLSFVISIIMGCISAYLAKRGGGNPYLWFGIGMFLGIFGILLFFIISSGKRTRVSQANETQDHTLTLDITPDISQEAKEKFWYYLSAKNEQFGPMSYSALKETFRKGNIHLSTYVWNEEMQNWKSFGEVFHVQKSEN